jgi:hypothetical protein
MEKGRNCRQGTDDTIGGWAVLSLRLEEKGKFTARVAGSWCGEFEAWQAISDNVSF